MGTFKVSRLPFLGPLVRAVFWEMPEVIVRLGSDRKGGGKRKKNQLLILKMDAMGDFLLFLRALHEIREVHPQEEWEITLLGNQLWKDLAIAANVADQYHFVDPWLFEINPLYRIKILSCIRCGRFDEVIQGVYSRSFYRDDLLVRASRTKRSIGYYGDTCNSLPSWRQRGNSYYAELFRRDDLPSLHMLQVHARFTASLGGSGKIFLPYLPTVDDILQVGDSHFVVVPGGSARIRQWPPERFAILAELINGRTGLQPVILGGKKDYRAAAEMIAASPALPWLDLCGKTSLMGALAVISRARFYVGNDTGLTHLATMARVRTLAIIGGAFPGRDFPYPDGIAPNLTTVANLPPCMGCGWQCNHLIEGRARCVHDISMDTVISSLGWL